MDLNVRPEQGQPSHHFTPEKVPLFACNPRCPLFANGSGATIIATENRMDEILEDGIVGHITGFLPINWRNINEDPATCTNLEFNGINGADDTIRRHVAKNLRKQFCMWIPKLVTKDQF